jgi:hypothetical protein
MMRGCKHKAMLLCYKRQPHVEACTDNKKTVSAARVPNSCSFLVFLSARFFPSSISPGTQNSKPTAQAAF